jgi:hypothetical protein
LVRSALITGAIGAVPTLAAITLMPDLPFSAVTTFASRAELPCGLLEHLTRSGRKCSHNDRGDSIRRQSVRSVADVSPSGARLRATAKFL